MLQRSDAGTRFLRCLSLLLSQRTLTCLDSWQTEVTTLGLDLHGVFNSE